MTYASQRQLVRVNKKGMCCGECYCDDLICPLGGKNWLLTARSLLQDYRCERERIPKEEIPVPEKGTIEQIDDIDDVLVKLSGSAEL